MALLVLGLLVWSAVHLVPTLAPALKQRWHSKLGEAGYMGSFTLALFLGLGLIIMGWRSTQPTLIYLPPEALRLPALAIIVLGFLLIGFTKSPGRIKQFVRHPQLAGVALWGIAHMMLNGDSRSLVLFGGMTCWCIAEILLISRREGTWVKAEVPPLKSELVGIGVGLAMLAVFVFTHPWLAGMPIH
jgi:uncharacterized membrane protein